MRTRKKQQDNTLALDGLFNGHDRLWVVTYRVDLGNDLDLFETIAFGPGARAEEGARFNAGGEELARAAHDQLLGEYGYRKTGLRKWKFFRQLEFNARGIVNVSRRPMSRKKAWIMTALWAFAIFLAVISLATGPMLVIALLLGFELVMLYQSIRGLLWSYNIPRR